MSFILDALRKSENERQRNQQPGIAAAQPPPRKGSGLWLPLVALLIGVNLSLILVMWIMSDGQPAATATPAATQAPASTPPYAGQTNRRLNSEVANPQPAIPATTPAALPTDIAVPPPVAADDTAESGLPSMEELLLNNSISLAPLQMDIHVYSDVPGERFVFINMTRYNEGQVLAEGPTLLAINPTGIVLRHQGYDFLVTRE